MDTNWRNIRFSVWFKILALLLGLFGCYFFSLGFFNNAVREYGPIPDAASMVSREQYPKAEELADRITSLFFREDSAHYIADPVEAQKEAERLAKEAGYDYTVFVDGNYTYGADITQSEYYDREFYYASGTYFGTGYYSGYQTNDTAQYEQSEKQVQVYVALPAASYAALYQDAKAASEVTVDALKYMLLGLLLLLISVVWLCYTAGRTPRDEEVHLYLPEKLWIDVAFGLAVALFSLSLLPGIALFRQSSSDNYIIEYFGAFVYHVVCVACIFVPFAIALFWCVIAVKRLKRREFWKSTFLYFFFSRFYRLLRRGFRFLFKKPHATKYILCVIVYSALLIIEMFFFFLAETGRSIMGAWIMFWIICGTVFLGIVAVKRHTAAQVVLADNIKIIRNGNLSHKIPPTGSTAVDLIADDVNNLSEGLKQSVASQVAAQKMKVELITNVSHDLKTPLTSIISYVDLLSKEPAGSEKSTEYIQVLKTKSARLKNLIEDLFEVAKAESGNIEVHMERLCLNDLLEQALGEYEEKFKAAGLAVRLGGTKDKLYILADSNKLWRVFSNLLNNIVKYTLPGSRVYIDILPDNGYVWVTFKNISSYEMNFTADEIVERFQRGDPSRTTEGSGLGLAIVNSFMERMGGRCDIATDGDLFKAMVLILAANPPETNQDI